MFSEGRISLSKCMFIAVTTFIILFSGIVFLGNPSQHPLEKIPLCRKTSAIVNSFRRANVSNVTNQIAMAMKSKFRILVWVMTDPSTLEKKARHVKATWGKHVDILLFISSVEDKNFPTIGLGTRDGKGSLTEKHFKAFQYVHDHYLDKADWFMKADTDTYVFVENLYHFLLDKNTNEPIWFGQPGPHGYTNVDFLSGGPGYVLSKEALRRFGRREKNLCVERDTVQDIDDVHWSRCMKKLGVRMGDNRDKLGRTRFFHQPPVNYVFRNEGEVLQLSDTPISFHQLSPAQLYLLEYLTYKMSIFGIRKSANELESIKEATPPSTVKPTFIDKV